MAAAPAYTVACPVYGSTPKAGASPRLGAKYDAARSDEFNRDYWKDADGLSASATNTPATRKVLRDRAWYEFANNCYMQGAVRAIVNDTVGTGARLKLETDDAALNDNVDDLWRLWSAASDWPLTSRVMAVVREISGECFGVFRNSKRLERMGMPITLDIRLLDGAQIADPLSSYLTRTTGDDGVICDEDGEVSAYKILRSDPGDLQIWTGYWQADTVAADDVLHWYVPERVNQLRGVCPWQASLPVFAQLRRFTSATLTAAEVASMLAGVLELPNLTMPNGEPAPSLNLFDRVEFARGMMITVPDGGKVSQFKPEQPTTNYDMFVRAKLCEAGRCRGMPRGKMLGDHSQYNFSSGRMDDGPYWADRDIERQALEAKVFNRVFYRWCEFAKFVIPGLVKYEGQWWKLKHSWHYDAKPSIDPVKEAVGERTDLENGTDSLPAIAERHNTTEDALIAARKRTMEKYLAAGLPLPAWLSGVTTPPPPGDGVPQNLEDSRAATAGQEAARG